jgi:hypothetical protein
MPPTPPIVYKSYRGDVLLGTITPDNTRSDFPWYAGIFHPTPDFETVRPLFENELSVLDSEDFDAWELAWQAITKPGLKLEYDNGEIVNELLIHIEGEKTWWRC